MRRNIVTIPLDTLHNVLPIIRQLSHQALNYSFNLCSVCREKYFLSCNGWGAGALYGLLVSR